MLGFMPVNLIGGSRSSSANFGSEPLLALPGGRIFDLAHGYVLLLVDFTQQDKASKGLWKCKPNERPKRPVHFSALRLMRDERVLLFDELYEGIWTDLVGVIPVYFSLENVVTLRTLCSTTLFPLVNSWSHNPPKKPTNGTSLLIIVDALKQVECAKGRELVKGIVAVDSLLSTDEKYAGTLFLGRSSAIQKLLADRYLVGHSLNTAVELFHHAPLLVEPIIRSVQARFTAAAEKQRLHTLIKGLIEDLGSNDQRGILLVSRHIDENTEFRSRVLDHILQVIEYGTPSLNERERAGRILSRLGDP
ncbi:putative C-type lectin protein [Seiridium unicorne]|uniref:C-type lectin protein n=1 Tax=Seiridium unicorne TaxID=138068 RepID=A0ABR2UFH5_9PEZI